MWNGLMRKDGVHVTSLDTKNRWVIIQANGEVAFEICPCCDKPLGSERAAKLVADTVLPPRRDAA